VLSIILPHEITISLPTKYVNYFTKIFFEKMQKVKKKFAKGLKPHKNILLSDDFCGFFVGVGWGII